jgi:hypothetical protein
MFVSRSEPAAARSSNAGTIMLARLRDVNWVHRMTFTRSAEHASAALEQRTEPALWRFVVIGACAV